MAGWIKIHRSIVEHWLYTEKRIYSRFEAWNDILLAVNYLESKCLIKGHLYTVKRGESTLSLDSWAKRWGWDKGRVRAFLLLLKKDNMIELKSDNITTHLTVCKYASYQASENAERTQKKLKPNSNQNQTTPIEEEEEYKERKEEEEYMPDFTFDDFWEMYPNKVAKAKCEPKFNKLTETEKQKIRGTLPIFLKHKPFELYNHPNPEAYLNQKRWEDELPTTKNQTQKSASLFSNQINLSEV